MNWGKFRSATIISLIVVFSLLSASEGRKIFEAVSDSRADDIRPFEVKGEEDSGIRAKPPALVDELDIQGGEISPVFDSNVFDYDMAVSGAVENLKISARFTLGTDHEKYKVKTKTITAKEDLADLQSQTGGYETSIVVEIHVSADEHQSVIYCLNIKKVSAGINPVWTVLFQIIFWLSVVLAAAVVIIFLYGLYMAYSGGILTGRGPVESFANGGGQYEAAGSSS